MSWGEDLRIRREELGYSLQNVEEETKIRRLYLEALENEDFSILPPKVYAVGFVKNYARFLRLDEKLITEQFKELAYSDESSEEVPFAYSNKPIIPGWLSATNVFAALVFLLLAIWVGNYLVGYFSGQNIVEEPIIPPIIQQPHETETEPEAEQQEPEEAATEPQNVNLAINARQDCWLEVTIDGETDFVGMIRAGEERIFAGERSVYILAGNAGGIDITVNKENVGAFGEVGQVKRQEFTI